MRPMVAVLGIGLILLGTVFALQGVNVLLGSYMSGRPEWAVIGTVAVLAGAALLLFGRRGKRS